MKLLQLFEVITTTANRFPTVHFPEVYHVGDMDPRKKRGDSHEGSGLSVSLHPDEWTKIARLGGNETHTLQNDSSVFLDFHKLSDEQKKTILTWGVENEYITPATIWRVSWYDDEMEDTVGAEFDNPEDAAAEAEGVGGEVEEIRGKHVSTPKMKQRVQGDASSVMLMDLLSTIFVEDVLGWDGVWWEDILKPEQFSAPRGVIVPSAMKRWAVDRSGLKEAITDDMRHEFMCGSCAFLALLLHREFGWPMVGYFDVDHEATEYNQSVADFLDEEPTIEHDDIHHIWVDIPGTGKAIDINGVQDANELTNHWAVHSGAKEDRGQYNYDVPDKWVENFIRRWNPTPQTRNHIYDMAKTAVQELKVELKREGLTEGAAIRTYDPDVLEWLQEALSRPDADDLYLHGSRQVQNVFSPEDKRHEHALIHFSKLTDPRFQEVPFQAEYYGPKLLLCKLSYTKPFDVRYPNKEPAQMHKELVPRGSQYKLDYGDIYHIIEPALAKGYDLFVVWEVAARTESYAVPDANQVQVIDTYDSREKV